MARSVFKTGEAEQVLLFHHDPLHGDDELDLLDRRAGERWLGLGGLPGELAMGIEGSEIVLLADGASYAEGPSLGPSRPPAQSPATVDRPNRGRDDWNSETPPPAKCERPGRN